MTSPIPSPADVRELAVRVLRHARGANAEYLADAVLAAVSPVITLTPRLAAQHPEEGK